MANRRVQPAENRFANQKMADVEFGKLRDRGNGDDIVIGKAVACVRFNAVFPCQRRRIGQTFQLRRAFFARTGYFPAGGLLVSITLFDILSPTLLQRVA